MRMAILAMILAAVPATAGAQPRIVRDGPNPVPDVRIHTPRPGVSWDVPAGSAPRFDSRDYQDMELVGDEAYADDADIPLYADDGYSDEGYSYAGEFRAEDRDRAYTRRMVRDDRDELDYDRDYPYEYPYRGGDRRRMIMIETVTTTTTAPTVRRITR